MKVGIVSDRLNRTLTGVGNVVFNTLYEISKIDKIKKNNYQNKIKLKNHINLMPLGGIGNRYKKEGFKIKNYSVVYNGIDTDRFKRVSYPDKLTIGIVARIDKMKGYIIFAKAIKEILNHFEK